MRENAKEEVTVASISKTELKWVITALNTHIEECEELMRNPDLNGLTRSILNHQREGYRALRLKLETASVKGAKQIRII